MGRRPGKRPSVLFLGTWMVWPAVEVVWLETLASIQSVLGIEKRV